MLFERLWDGKRFWIIWSISNRFWRSTFENCVWNLEKNDFWNVWHHDLERESQESHRRLRVKTMLALNLSHLEAPKARSSFTWIHRVTTSLFSDVFMWIVTKIETEIMRFEVWFSLCVSGRGPSTMKNATEHHGNYGTEFSVLLVRKILQSGKITTNCE